MGNAHSEYLSALSETGILGFLAFIVLVSTIFFTGVRLYYKIDKQDLGTRAIVIACILGLSTYFIHGFLNNYLDTDKASIPIWGICAIFIALANQKNTAKEDSL
jgi:O-antigen ligase